MPVPSLPTPAEPADPAAERAVAQVRRARRTVATLAAAAVVVLLPTACTYAQASTPSSGSSQTTSGSGQSGGHGGGHGGHGGGVTTEPVAVTTTPDPDEDAGEEGETPPTDTDAPDSEAPGSEAPAPPANPGLAILGDDCSTSDLDAHTGFQDAPRCVGTAFGEVAAAADSPSLLITDAPRTVRAGEAFTLEVSTRNLVRDRFLGAAAGGYYRESSFLNADGIQRGHFHTACRMLPSLTVAPDSSPAPAFFLATQDNGGGVEPDVVSVPVTGLTTPGTAQCAVWAGDGSHRVPMMQRANQTPAFDIVRITVE